MAEISARRRHHRETDTSDNNNTRRIRTATTPPYEPPSYPLNPSGQVALSALLQGQTLRNLKTHLQHASEKLTDSAGEVNERLTDAKARYERMKERRQNNSNGDDGDDDGEDEEFRKLTQTEERVKSITGRLDEGIRGVIDAEAKTEGFVGVVTALAGEEGQSQSQGQGHGGRGGRRRDGRRTDGDDYQDEEEEDQDENEDEDENEERSRDNNESKPNFDPTLKKLEGRLAENYASWEQHSLTQRYSTNNTYVGFYRIVHESKHPSDETPPLPHASTWFSHLENSNQPNSNSRTAETAPTVQNQNEHSDRRARTTTTTPESDNNNDGDGNDDEDDDEVAVQRERISLKCPLTLLPYQDPITSTKCPHSFERHAIQDMIQRSPLTVPISNSAAAVGGTTGGNPARTRENNRTRVQAVKCPVCAAMLTKDDFVTDVALLRRVRRVEAAMQREEAEEELDAAVEAANGGKRRRTKGGRKSGITVASDDEEEDAAADDKMDADGRVRVKSERVLSRNSSATDDE